MFFENCTTLEELKKAYKAAALKNHPDLGGNVATMQAVNKEYTAKFEALKHKHNATNSKKSTEVAEEFKDIINAVIGLEGLEIELCGSWLWFAGNTYEHRAALKKAGCKWSKSKQKWYWRHAEKGCRWSRGNATMEDIRTKYGSEVFQACSRKSLQGA